MKTADQLIEAHCAAGVAAREAFFKENLENTRNSALQTALRFAQGSKLLICGNGGSAADAQHVAGELVNRFLIDRPALPAVALTTDTSVITAIGNDSSFETIFARQVQALGKENDVLLAISTSGNSANVIAALEEAALKNMYRIGLTGPTGGKMAGLCDILLKTPSVSTPVIQEIHLAFEHLFCQLIDYYLFENVGELKPYLNKGK